jgi:hypothetical protein
MTRVILRPMKVAISIPDPVFEAAEEASRRLGISRSQFYAQAVESLLRETRSAGVREALDRVYGSEASALDPVLDTLQAEALRVRLVLGL